MIVSYKVPISSVKRARVALDPLDPASATKEVVQFDVRFPDYPELPSYGAQLDVPTNQAAVLALIRTIAQNAKNQWAETVAFRANLGTAILEGQVEVI